jgi:hypothetical protein
LVVVVMVAVVAAAATAVVEAAVAAVLITVAPQNVIPATLAQLAPYTKGTGLFSPGGKTAGT